MHLNQHFKFSVILTSHQNWKAHFYLFSLINTEQNTQRSLSELKVCPFEKRNSLKGKNNSKTSNQGSLYLLREDFYHTLLVILPRFMAFNFIYKDDWSFNLQLRPLLQILDFYIRLPTWHHQLDVSWRPQTVPTELPPNPLLSTVLSNCGQILGLNILEWSLKSSLSCTSHLFSERFAGSTFKIQAKLNYLSRPPCHYCLSSGLLQLAS